MKKTIWLLAIVSALLPANKPLAQNVAINSDGTPPNASAMLDIKSTTKGLLIPRMTTAQRTAIVTPALGLKVFDTNTRTFHFYNGTKWVEIASVTPDFWLLSGVNGYNLTGNVGVGTNLPASRLHVVGNEASVPFRIQNKLVTGHTAIHFYNSSNVAIGQVGFGNISAAAFANSFYAGSIGSAPFIFTTSNIERMRIDNAGSVGIGAAGIPAASAILEIKSTNKGLLIPRMTLGQRNLIAGPATSLLIYQTDNTPGYYYYNGTGWVQLTSGGSTNSWAVNTTNIFNTNAGNVGIGVGAPADKLTVQSAYDTYGITSTDGNVKISTYIGKGGGAWFGTQSNHRLHIYTNGNGTPNITFNTDFNTDVRGIKPRFNFYDETNGFNLSGDIRSNNNDLEIAAYKSTSFLSNSTPGNLILQADEPSSEILIGATAGNVGVGTDVPDFKLTVKSSLVQSNTNTHVLKLVGRNPVLDFTDGATSYGYIKAWSYQPYAPFTPGLVLGAQPGQALFLSTNYGATMTVANNNNVGIGTATPTDKLTVQTANGNYGITHTIGDVSISTWIGNYGGATGGWIGTKSIHPLNFFTGGGAASMTLQINGNVGIGTTNPTHKLSVNGTTQSKEVIVETGWADYVFDKKYKLLTLDEVEKFIQQNNHLPNIPSAKDVEENGLYVGDTQRRMMEKIEELTLYLIDANKRIEKLEQKLAEKNSVSKP